MYKIRAFLASHNFSDVQKQSDVDNDLFGLSTLRGRNDIVYGSGVPGPVGAVNGFYSDKN